MLMNIRETNYDAVKKQGKNLVKLFLLGLLAIFGLFSPLYIIYKFVTFFTIMFFPRISLYFHHQSQQEIKLVRDL